MPYTNKPTRLLTPLKDSACCPAIRRGGYCAGFELEAWRCDGLAGHLLDWIADYALKEDELRAVDHTNMYVKLREAAVRIYTTENYAKRGEVGEILLHAICRDFFDTIPIAPRVFYLTAANEVVKSFDMVHVRYSDHLVEGAGVPSAPAFELWLGEAKFYKDASDALSAAIASIQQHLDQGFLNREKLILGPQISKHIPHYDAVRALFSTQASLDALFAAAVFPVCIACDSNAVKGHKILSPEYQQAVTMELNDFEEKLIASGITTQIRICLLYVPLGSKDQLAQRFDARLKGLGA